MIAGRLKEKIDIYTTAKTTNAIGETITNDSLIISVYADVLTDMSSILNTDNVITNQTVATFTIRNYPVITYDNYIIFNSDKYIITGINKLLNNTGQKIKAVKHE